MFKSKTINILARLPRIRDAFSTKTPEYFYPNEAEKAIFSYAWDDVFKHYHRQHLNRYCVTLDLLQDLPKETKVLDIGALPYGLTILMKEFLFNEVQPTFFNHFNNSRDKEACTVSHYLFSKDSGKKVELKVHNFNIETHRWPFQKESFDLIVASEIFEHLALDPMNAISEANRILVPGGKLLITAPNAVDYSNLLRLVKGLQPNHFPPFRPEGVNLRHNRELTPKELAVLFEAGGFDVEYIKTVCINKMPAYLSTLFLFGLVQLIISSCKDRGDLLMGMGIKSREVQERYPIKHNLYCKWDVERWKRSSGVGEFRQFESYPDSEIEDKGKVE